MKTLLTIVAIVLAAVIAFFTARYFLEDKDDISGTWVIAKMEQDGRELPGKALTIKMIHFEKDAVVWLVLSKKNQPEEIQREFKIDPSKNPKHMDLGTPFSAKGVTLAIYQVKDGTMRLALGDSKTRPQDFSGDGPNAVFYLVRQQEPR